jgi:hypothetical protein
LTALPTPELPAVPELGIDVGALAAAEAANTELVLLGRMFGSGALAGGMDCVLVRREVLLRGDGDAAPCCA